MKQFIFLLIIIVVILISFRSNKCEHIYVAVEKSDIKISEPQWYGVDSLMPPFCYWPSGKREGKEIVCIKCFDKRRQIIYYSERQHTSIRLPYWPTATLKDTSMTAGICSALTIKVDSTIPLSFKRK